MGANSVHETRKISEYANVTEAWKAAWDEDRDEYGHQQGYSGSLSAKDSFQLYPHDGRDLAPSGLDAQDVVHALQASTPNNRYADAYSAERLTKLLTAMPGLERETEHAASVYDDKWADMIVFRHGEFWHFVGMASS